MNKSVLLIILGLTPFYLYAADGINNCHSQSANFAKELAQPFGTDNHTGGWGAKRNSLSLPPELNQCIADLNWQRKRIIAAADYWVSKKLNYCHHHVPSYITPISQRNRKVHQGGYCNPAKDIMPHSVYYQQIARWNYDGKGNETAKDWVNQNMWKGLDCSNYTTFLYDFAIGTEFSSNVEWQAGQRKGEPKRISPNQQSASNILDNVDAAGSLVCADNSLETNHSCRGHGGYISVIDKTGQKHKGSIKASDLASLPLYPGDLLYIAATGADSLYPSKVTHVVMWTGKKVGYGPNDINPTRIAPNKSCAKEEWMPKIGDWVITDSHYQGPDYRVLTPCFYLNNLWGVRRVIY